MSSTEKATLRQVDPWKIEPNKDNPRRLFDEDKLETLKQSIKEVGVLVPLIIYRNENGRDTYILLDGERRLRCARSLKLSTVPCHEISAPTREENILRMFNIHNVREDWDLVPTALKLETLIELLRKRSGKEPSTKLLAEQTGMNSTRIADCIRVLRYKKYHDLVLNPDPTKRLSGDFFSQLDIALDRLEGFPEILEEIPRDKIIQIMIKKKQQGIIKTSLEFRTLRRILTSEKKGISRKTIVHNVKQFIRSEPEVDTSGKVKSSGITIDQIYEKTAQSRYFETQLVKATEKLDLMLAGIEEDGTEDKELLASLKKIGERIKRIIKSN